MAGRGSAPGERRGGRKPGTPNKVTADVRSLAQEYGPKALKTLAEIMEAGEQPASARVSAAKELLDRAYGKSPQPVDVTTQPDTKELASVVADALNR